MELYFFRAPSGVTNFGDEINPWLLPRIIPELSTTPGDDLLIGIGTLLNDLLPASPTKHILGTGAGYGTSPAVPDASWRVHFVRGPLTAKLLKLPAEAAVTDGAILIPSDWLPTSRGNSVGYMPHWQSPLQSWRELVTGAGIKFIDPTQPVETVLSQIADCKLVITEAMHGAILADIMRIPWVPVTTRADILDFKWRDWCGSLSLNYAPVGLPPVWNPPADLGQLGKVRRWAKFKKIGRALTALRHNSKCWHLSADDTFLDRKTEALSRLTRLREELADAQACALKG